MNTLDTWIALVAAAALVAAVCTGILGGWSARREAAARPPRRLAVASNGAEILTPGRPSDTVGHCLHCPWEVSDPSALAAHAALTAHVRAAHGGIP